MKLILADFEFEKHKTLIKVLPRKEDNKRMILNEEIPTLIEFLKYCTR